MEIEELVTKISTPVSDKEISHFENDYAVIIPQQYKDLLKYSNGADVVGTFNHPLHPGEDWKITIYPTLASIEELRRGMNEFHEINLSGMKYQYQEKILQIGGTQEGSHIMLGFADPIKDQVFIEDTDDLTMEREIPLILLAPTLIDFLKMLEPFS